MKSLYILGYAALRQSDADGAIAAFTVASRDKLLKIYRPDPVHLIIQSRLISKPAK